MSKMYLFNFYFIQTQDVHNTTTKWKLRQQNRPTNSYLIFLLNFLLLVTNLHFFKK